MKQYPTNIYRASMFQLRQVTQTEKKLAEQLQCESLDGGPPGQNLARRFTIFEFSKKYYTWPCSD